MAGTAGPTYRLGLRRSEAAIDLVAGVAGWLAAPLWATEVTTSPSVVIPVSVASAAVLVVVLYRALRVNLTLDNDGVVVTNVFRTIRLPWKYVVDFDFDPECLGLYVVTRRGIVTVDALTVRPHKIGNPRRQTGVDAVRHLRDEQVRCGHHNRRRR